MPLAAAWAEGLPRARAIFARAREAGSDVGSVTPDFDEYPGVRELRRRMERDASRLRWWKDGFEALVAACACKPVATMRELLAFWLDIDVLEEACDAGGIRLCVEMSPPTRVPRNSAGWRRVSGAELG